MIFSTFRQYGNGQRVGFAVVCIGFAFCFVGCVSPYWMTAKVSPKSLTNMVLGDDNIISNLVDKVSGDTSLVKVSAGIWMYCININIPFSEDQTKCYTFYNNGDNPDGFERRHGSDWINIVRSLVSFNIIFSFIAMCVACCRCLCCSGGRTICHGVLSFLAGGCGMGAFIIAFNKTKDLLNIPVLETDYDWALTLYTLGSVLLMVASLLLCFGAPREMYAGGVVLANQMTPTVSVNVNNSNTNHMTNQYVGAGQINSFEPLPQAPPPYAGNAGY